MSCWVLQKVFSLPGIMAHLDLEPYVGAVQTPVYILRNSAVGVYWPVVIYGARRTPEPRLLTSHYKPQSHSHGFTYIETGNFPPPHPELKVHVNLSNFLQSLNHLKSILFLPSSHILQGYEYIISTLHSYCLQ